MGVPLESTLHIVRDRVERNKKTGGASYLLLQLVIGPGSFWRHEEETLGALAQALGSFAIELLRSKVVRGMTHFAGAADGSGPMRAFIHRPYKVAQGIQIDRNYEGAARTICNRH